MTVKVIEDLDISQIAESGQVFRIREKTPGIWAVPAGEHYMELKQQGKQLLCSCEEAEFDAFWSAYWNLDLDYGKVKASADPDDTYLTRACAYGWGIRILKQDLWEMIITFLISQNNNMVRIRKSVEALCEVYGGRKTGTGLCPDGNDCMDVEYYSFPRPEALAEASPDQLRQMGLGYRDKYISQMAAWCSSQEGKQWLALLLEADYEHASAMLVDRPGIGRKVADCICLFGLHLIDAFPMDTHVKQIVSAHYPDGFPLKKYQGYAGIMQQYMFYYKVREDGKMIVQ